jgi:hypothetical protein
METSYRTIYDIESIKGVVTLKYNDTQIYVDNSMILEIAEKIKQESLQDSQS